MTESLFKSQFTSNLLSWGSKMVKRKQLFVEDSQNLDKKWTAGFRNPKLSTKII